jgi:hypothetical protein
MSGGGIFLLAIAVLLVFAVIFRVVSDKKEGKSKQV